ncbi:DcrB/PsbP domain-containing protein [Tenggerimyces flavus]|uniref:DcrB-related protein n=1 Tax=Tenggerimyces flavus TaxID=1708749 RepID=A0ABV7Y9G2_9ACTN|nr:DcrB-related protein [Tenggerimyces flavus]MBM7783744.1 hypothetical protein [Tenggerimyces flavus]
MRLNRPTLGASAPPEWLFKETITLSAPENQANVIVSSEAVSPTFTTSSYADAQGRLLSTEFPHYTEHRYEGVLLFGEHVGMLREFSWTPPDGVRVRQVQWYCVIEGRGYTATATSVETEFERRRTTLVEVLLSAEARR